MKRIESFLENKYPAYRAVVTYRGSSALYLALAEIKRRRGEGEVLVPATVCSSVPLMIQLAGLTPRFCDVEPDTFCMSERTINESVGEKTIALVLVHLFGRCVEPAKISALARKRGMTLIEDVAQAVGGDNDGSPVGSHGDFTVFSFNRSKIVRGSSGALIIRNPETASQIRALQEALPQPPRPLHRAELATSYRNFVTGLYDLKRSGTTRRLSPLFQSVAEEYRPLFIGRVDEDGANFPETAQSLSTLQRSYDTRRANYECFAALFSKAVSYVRFPPGQMCWRLPVLLRSHADQLELLERLKTLKIPVSNHYFPSSVLFEDAVPPTVAERIGLCAINLCVDNEMMSSWIKLTALEVNRVAGRRIG